MNLSSVATLLLGLLAAASAMDIISLDEGQLAEIELRRQAKRSSKLDCEQVKILLTNANVDAGQSSEVSAGGLPKAFDRQGGVIALSDPNDVETVIGDYTYLITFLDDFFGCVANGAYTFTTGDQITFTASCSGLPYFSITGGRGKYSGAEGFVEFQIPTDDGTGNFHEINICSYSDNVGKKSKESKESKKSKESKESKESKKTKDSSKGAKGRSRL
jgi:hypothetical protein